MLKTQLDELKPKLDELIAEERLDTDEIKNHCDRLRNEMQLASEEAIEAIKSFILENIEYINSFEKETMEKVWS